MNPNVIEIFAFKWRARLYAMRARMKGYNAYILDYGRHGSHLPFVHKWAVEIEERG